SLWVQGIVYGDFESPGVSDAVVPLACSNNGGTADGQLLFSLAAFSGATGPRNLLHVTLIGQTRHGVVITPGEVRVTEYFYGPHDGTCCDSGLAMTTWHYRNGTLVASRPVILKQPQRH